MGGGMVVREKTPVKKEILSKEMNHIIHLRKVFLRPPFTLI